MHEHQLTRRDWLQNTALAGGALAVGLGGQTTMADEAKAKPPKEGWIDAHVHVWTPDTKKYPLAKKYAVKDMVPPSFTPKELWAEAEPVGVRRIVLIQMSFYGYDNTYMLAAIRDYPGRFAGVAVIDENDKPAATMKKLAGQGVRGFRILPAGRPIDQWLTGPGMAEMWQCGAEENLSMCHLIDANSLPYVDRMCRKYPETPVVIDHFARIGVDGQVREADLKNLCALAGHKHTSVKVSAFYALGKKKAPYEDLGPMIRRLVEAFGPERLMWATDCPYQVQEGHTYADSLALVRDRLDFLSDADKQAILATTAERIFFAPRES